MKSQLLFYVGALLLATACSPKIYVIDRQTVLEQEAAGQWPQFEKDLVNRLKAQGPTPLQQVPINAQRARLYNVLNGELTSSNEAAPGVRK